MVHPVVPLRSKSASWSTDVPCGTVGIFWEFLQSRPNKQDIPVSIYKRGRRIQRIADITDDSNTQPMRKLSLCCFYFLTMWSFSWKSNNHLVKISGRGLNCNRDTPRQGWWNSDHHNNLISICLCAIPCMYILSRAFRVQFFCLRCCVVVRLLDATLIGVHRVIHAFRKLLLMSRVHPGPYLPWRYGYF